MSEFKTTTTTKTTTKTTIMSDEYEYEYEQEQLSKLILGSYKNYSDKHVEAYDTLASTMDHIEVVLSAYENCSAEKCLDMIRMSIKMEKDLAKQRQ